MFFLSLSHTHTHTHTHTHLHTLIHKFRFQLMDISLIASALFQDSLPIQTDIDRTSFSFLQTQGSTIDSIHGLLFISRALKVSIDTTVSF